MVWDEFDRDWFDDLKRLKKRMNRFFKFFNEAPFESSSFREPLMDFFEEDGEYVVYLELPGVEKKDIELNIVDHGLEIKVEKNVDVEKKREGFYRFERSYSGFYRVVPLPADADVDKLRAKYKNGILEVRIKKKTRAKKRGRSIKIE